MTSGDIAARTGLSRQAVHRHLRRMVEAGELFAEGAGRGAHYVARRRTFRKAYRRAGLDEAALYREVSGSLPGLARLPRTAERVFHYAFTELANNAVDHSAAHAVETEVRLDEDKVCCRIEDDGIGAFERVRSTFRLRSAVESVGEISKGRTTTDPERHTGQGLFFCSKAVDRLDLESNGVRWIVDNRRRDIAIGASDLLVGTRVRFEVDRGTSRELKAIFDEYTTDLEFDRTRAELRLFAYGTEFVSRSEAKRLLRGLERFREVTLDFAGVGLVGQGFADEVFRVWARAHPGTRLLPANMVEPVAFMVRRAMAT